MSADIINIAARRPAAGPIDISGAETERQYAGRLLRKALDYLKDDDLTGAERCAKIATAMLGRLFDSGVSEEEERAEIVRQHRRIERGAKAADTRRRNRERQEEALAAVGIVLTPDGFETAAP